MIISHYTQNWPIKLFPKQWLNKLDKDKARLTNLKTQFKDFLIDPVAFLSQDYNLKEASQSSVFRLS